MCLFLVTYIYQLPCCGEGFCVGKKKIVLFFKSDIESKILEMLHDDSVNEACVLLIFVCK